MRIYVAGASKEVDECAAAIQSCRDAGFDCTHDWTRSVIAHREKGETDDSLSKAERGGYAAGDLDGVRAADIFWLRVPKGGSPGAWIELGAAIILNKHILVSEDHGRSIFTQLAHVHRDTHEGALDYLRERIRSCRP
jgi:hypothetical protein